MCENEIQIPLSSTQIIQEELLLVEGCQWTVGVLWLYPVEVQLHGWVAIAGQDSLWALNMTSPSKINVLPMARFTKWAGVNVESGCGIAE